MTIFKRFITSAVAVTALAAGANANTIIGYTVTLGPTSTDITNTSVVLPSWNPGGANGASSNVSGGSYTTGVSMSGLDTANNIYTLVGFNISVKETLTGNYTIMNSSTASTATGSAHIDTYTAVGLGSTLAPPLSNTSDPSNDLFNCSATLVGKTTGTCTPNAQGEQPTSLGGGPDPNSPESSSFTINPNGGSFNSGSINVNSLWVDYGCEIQNNVFAGCQDLTARSNGPNELTSGFGLINGTNDLAFYFSSATQTITAVTGGNLSTQYNTSVTEQVEVTYDYITTPISSTPEPTTMVLFGSALLGIGLLRKRMKKN